MGQTPMWNGKDAEGNFMLKEGDVLEGVFVSVKPDVGSNHANVYTFKKANGEVVSVWGSTILDTRFENLNPGEEVMVKYLGYPESKQRKGAHYHSYDVFHRMPETQQVPVINENEEIPASFTPEDSEEIDIKEIPF